MTEGFSIASEHDLRARNELDYLRSVIGEEFSNEIRL